MRKICVVTGSRAEYGLLSGLMRAIQQDEELQLQIIATNMHLSPEFGLTYKEIEQDGFKIDKKVQMLLSGDTSNATTKSVGLATIGFADAYEDLKPDLLIVLGVGWNQFNRLEEQYNQIKIEQIDYKYKIDSLSKINNQRSHIIDSISLNICDLQKDIDILNQDKQKLEAQLDDFQIKTNLDENVILLRKNIAASKSALSP